MKFAQGDVLETGEKEMRIRWKDGHEGVYSFFELRKACPCALCRAKESPKPWEIIPPDIKIKEIIPVGLYALQFVFSDEHDTGLYTFPLLKSLCQCPNCSKQKADNREQ